MRIENKERAKQVLKETLKKGNDIAKKLWSECQSTIYLDAKQCDGDPKFVFDGCRLVEIEQIDLSSPCRVIGVELISFKGTQYNVYDLRG
jgi:hypothetical protein